MLQVPKTLECPTQYLELISKIYQGFYSKSLQLMNSVLCHIYSEDKDHYQQSDWGHPRKCGYHSEKTHSYGEGPRSTLQRDFNHINKEKEEAPVDKWWGNRKELATIHTICSHVQNTIRNKEAWIRLSASEGG
ncbi:hypothetical protein QTO34_000255 [Cnephaeus nilssonii]|uniref:Uncharacterized protein n=1 Tax=Cnephaeus nilssonii TaxID=3371016 RepID=A0AA40IB52_CNENI|nr:hypothetical protein QTO34_000255 [Eptesicus nilssonii]